MRIFFTKKKLENLLNETWLQGQEHGYKVGEQDALIRVVKNAPLPDGFLDELSNKFYTGAGQRLGATHPRTNQCDDRGCVIHNPSDHGMRHMKTLWRGDRYLMERLCEHGVGHPDPDDMSFKKRTMSAERYEVEGVHGCDGCCSVAVSPKVQAVNEVMEEFPNV